MVPYVEFDSCFSDSELKEPALMRNQLKAKKYSAEFDETKKMWIPGAHPYKAEHIIAWTKRVLEGKE